MSIPHIYCLKGPLSDIMVDPYIGWAALSRQILLPPGKFVAVKGAAQGPACESRQERSPDGWEDVGTKGMTTRGDSRSAWTVHRLNAALVVGEIRAVPVFREAVLSERHYRCRLRRPTG